MVGAWIVGIFVALLGLAGLFLASSAHENPTFYTMGLALFVFSIVIIATLIKKGFDEQGHDG